MAFEIDFIDGFDAYGTDEAVMQKEWYLTATNITYLSNTVHRGSSGSSLLFVTSLTTGYAKKALKKPYRCLIVGFAVFYPETVAGFRPDESPITFNAGSTRMITLQLQDEGHFVLKVGNTAGAVLATGTTIMAASTWHYLELKVFIDNAAGAYEFKINGVTEFSDTGVDTNASSTINWVNSIWFENAGTSGPYDFYIDDLYARGDVTTNTAGGFLGDTRVVVLRPDADGTYEQWTLSTGVDAFALIDEDLPDTADYLESSTAAQKYSVSHTSFTGTGTIHAVSHYVHSSTPDNTARNVYPLCRSNGVDYQNPSVRAPSGAYLSSVYETNPNTATAWTDTTLNAAEFGLEIV